MTLFVYKKLCTIWYPLHLLKNVKNTFGGVLLLVKLQAEATFFHRYFSSFLNGTNGTKLNKASYMGLVFEIDENLKSRNSATFKMELADRALS